MVGSRLHTKDRVFTRGNVRHVPGTTSDGKGDWIETILTSKGEPVATVHGSTAQEAAEAAEFIVLAINKFKKGL